MKRPGGPLDRARIDQFIAWSRGKRISHCWVREQTRILTALVAPLAGHDLRGLSLAVLLPLSRSAPHKIATVKALDSV